MSNIIEVTPEIIENTKHISKEEMLGDIEDTQREIDDKREILRTLNRNPVENKLQIYLAEGYISQRESFIEKVNSILLFRSTKEIV